MLAIRTKWNQRFLAVSFLVTIWMSKSGSRKCPVAENCNLLKLDKLDIKENPYPNTTNWTDPHWHEPIYEGDQYVDVMFVVDGSASMSESKFRLVQRWVVDFIQNFDLSSGKFQVGFVQYSHWYRWKTANNQKDIRTDVILGSCQNATCLKEKFAEVNHIGHTAFTGFAINKTVNEDFRASSKFDAAMKIMIVITDSVSNDQVVHSANYARLLGIHIFAIGLSKNVNFNELRNIATGNPEDNRRIYALWEVDELDMITSSLLHEMRYLYTRMVCPPLAMPIHGFLECTEHNDIGSRCSIKCSYDGFSVIGEEGSSCHLHGAFLDWNQDVGTCGVCEAKFDLLLIVDSSSSVRCRGFSNVKKFLLALLDSLHVGPDHVQVALMRYYSEAYHEFNYDEHRTKNSLLNAIRTLQYCGMGTRTGNALRYAVQNQFTSESGRRYNTPHITLLLTDGTAQDKIRNPSKDLQLQSHVICIGVKKASTAELETMSSQPIIPVLSTIYPDHESLLNVSLIRYLLQGFCDSAKSVQNVRCDIRKLERNVTCVNDNAADDYLKSPGTVCRLPCVAGYKNPGDSSALCTYSGMWHRKNWKCIEKDCGPLSVGGGVAVSCQKSNEICLLKCTYGFDILAPEEDSQCEKYNDHIISCTATCERVNGRDPKWNVPAIQCKETTQCTETSCVNGKCTKIEDRIFCQCNYDYTGSRCEVSIDDCEGVNCNSGFCKDGIGTFRCVCDAGFRGTLCTININDCSPNVCGNGGRCNDEVNGYSCSCRPGYGGRNCELLIDECASNPCLNDGRCRDYIASYKCDCKHGFTGKNCETEINECKAKYIRCVNSNTVDCIDKVDGYDCLCKKGWSGTACHRDVDECAPNPCIQGKCENSLGSFNCKCNKGYRGDYCDVTINYCEEMKPCQNGGQCANTIGSYSCLCKNGFTGANCATNIDECQFVNCNKGRCQDGIGTFQCLCNPGYTGKFCNVDIDECASNPCVHGFCKQGRVDHFWCRCANGYEGLRCEHDVDECSKVPPICQNGANCTNLPGSFECRCPDGYHGKFCEKKICQLLKKKSSEGQIQCSRELVTGSSCNIACPVGTRLKSFKNDSDTNPTLHLSVTCLESGEWSPTRFLQHESNSWQCIAIGCPPLHRTSSATSFPYTLKDRDSTPDSVHVIACTNGYKVGSKCTLTCHKNFSWNGKSSRVCGNNGVWSGRKWRCLRIKEGATKDSCHPQDIPLVKNGKYSCPQGHESGKKCVLICEPGFMQDDREVGGLVCVKSDTSWTWRKLGSDLCYVAECEAAIDFKSNEHIQPSDFFSVANNQVLVDSNKHSTNKCSTGRVISINITKENNISMFLYFGESISGNYFQLMIDETSNLGNRKQRAPFAIHGLGSKIFLKGFKGTEPTMKDPQEQTAPNSTAALTITYNYWKWQSITNEWFAHMKWKEDLARNSWYSIRVGLNRNSNGLLAGYGLCKVCLSQN